MLGYTITQWIFGILSFMAIMCALMVVFSRNPVNSVLYLVLTFFCIAGHYLLLNSQFLAVVHIAVYAGAIMVLFLFVIMLMNLNQDTEPQKNISFKNNCRSYWGASVIRVGGNIARNRAIATASLWPFGNWFNKESWTRIIQRVFVSI